jgi:hypothetical protein
MSAASARLQLNGGGQLGRFGSPLAMSGLPGAWLDANGAATSGFMLIRGDSAAASHAWND